MKMPIASLTLLALCLAVAPAVAQDIWDNGPTNGTTDGWTINSGFAVSDFFYISPGPVTTITWLFFEAWILPGDVLQSAEVSITSSEFGGTSYFDQTLDFTPSSCVTNQYGYNVCEEASPFLGLSLNGGTYWFTLSNATVNNGDPVYWDENSGPSSASENSVGTIPSESFTVNGYSDGTVSTTGSTPEAGSIMLFGSGVLCLAGVLRRKLF